MPVDDTDVESKSYGGLLKAIGLVPGEDYGTYGHAMCHRENTAKGRD